MKKFVFVLFMIIFFACKNESKTDQQPKLQQKNTTVKNYLTQEEYCYLKVIGKSSNLKDSIQLNFNIKDAKVSGNYSWIFAEKDNRKGSIEAEITTNNTIEGIFIFNQEGKVDTEPIKILVKENSAKVISGKDKTSQVSFKIKKWDCN